MLFSSISFFFFFLVYFSLNYFLKANQKIYLIIFGSMIFYSFWYPYYFWVPILLTLVGFYGAQILDNFKNRTALFLIICSALIAPLIIFKYYDFIITKVLLLPSSFALDLNLPLGISFISFTMIAYIVETFRKDYPIERNLKSMFAYVLFFPQLIAGPIIRPAQLLPRLNNIKEKFSQSYFQLGLFIFFIGLLKKLIFADQVGFYVDNSYANFQDLNSLEALLTSYAFSVQIYCDFSGYTDMAIGLGMMLGIRLPINFNRPYIATSISDFWRRWHITLSTWLRDYLYIPMGGSKFGKLLTLRNLIITMFLGGIWHGAGWNFIVWGLVHGITLAAYHLLFSKKPKEQDSKFSRSLKVFFMFNFISLTWIFFRSPDIDTAITIIGSFSNFGDLSLGAFFNDNIFYIILIVIFLFSHSFDTLARLRLFHIKSNVFGRILFYVAIISLIVAFGSSSSEKFIYYDF